MLPLDDASATTEPRLSAPVYLRLNGASADKAVMSVREHLAPAATGRSDAPLVVITLLPGFLIGSYADRDYFEILAPLLFQSLSGACRLRIFTVNHPGYDLPAGQRVDHRDLRPYSIHRQPAAMHAAFSWVFDHLLADEPQIHWLAYGHSMGGLALSRYAPDALVDHLAREGRRLAFTRILSAPSFCLHARALAILDQLEALQTIRKRFGRLPLYAPLATGLYRAFAPLFYRREAERFSIGALADYGDFRALDPFVLLTQGQELLQLSPQAVGGPRLLDGTHLILAAGDGMVDLEETRAFVAAARDAGHTVETYLVDSTHLLERDDPDAVVAIVRTVLAGAVAGCRSALL